MMLNALLHRFRKGSEESLIQFLSDEDKALLSEHPAMCTSARELILSSDEALNRIHYSWLVPVIRTFPENIQPFLVGSLPAHMQKRLSEISEKLPAPAPLSPTLQQFFQKQLVNQVMQDNILPPSLVPHSPLNPLLHFAKKDLIVVIDFLGINDLAAEFHQIIDGTILKSLTSHLSPNKQRYLKATIPRPPAAFDGPLPLNALNGDPHKLEVMLHRKGLARLGTALAGSDSSLLWHITRALDSGRAQILDDFQAKPDARKTAPIMTSQVVTVMQFLKNQV